MRKLRPFWIAIRLAWITVIVCIKVIWVARTDPKKALGYSRNPWGPSLLKLAQARLHVEGKEQIDFAQSAIYVMNHQSLMDVPSVFSALPINLCFVAKKEIERIPFFGKAMKSVGMIFVDRSHPDKAIQSLKEGGALIRSGINVMAFPEGTRSQDGCILPFKRGIFLLALEAQVPIVPLAIEGARHVLHPSGFNPTPGEIRLKIGSPIYPPFFDSHPNASSLSGEEQVNILRYRVRQAVIDLHQELLREFESNPSIEGSS